MSQENIRLARPVSKEVEAEIDKSIAAGRQALLVEGFWKEPIGPFDDLQLALARLSESAAAFYNACRDTTGDRMNG